MPNNYMNISYDEIISILKKESTCVLSMCDNNIPYAVFMCYKLTFIDNNMYIELKTKSTGIKMTCLEKNKKVCLLFKKNTFSSDESIIAFGIVSISDEEIIDCVSCPQNCANCRVNCSSKELKKLKVKIKEISGRRYKK